MYKIAIIIIPILQREKKNEMQKDWATALRSQNFWVKKLLEVKLFLEEDTKENLLHFSKTWDDFSKMKAVLLGK